MVGIRPRPSSWESRAPRRCSMYRRVSSCRRTREGSSPSSMRFTRHIFIYNSYYIDLSHASAQVLYLIVHISAIFPRAVECIWVFISRRAPVSQLQKVGKGVDPTMRGSAPKVCRAIFGMHPFSKVRSNSGAEWICPVLFQPRLETHCRRRARGVSERWQKHAVEGRISGEAQDCQLSVHNNHTGVWQSMQLQSFRIYPESSVYVCLTVSESWASLVPR